MFICEVYTVEGQVWDVVAGREIYCTTKGRGMSLRSAKKAMDMAKAEFRKAAKKNSVRHPYGGVPVLGGVVVFKNGKKIKETW